MPTMGTTMEGETVESGRDRREKERESIGRLTLYTTE